MHDVSWHRGVSPWIIAMTVMLATFMEVLDTSVANVSLPHIAGNLSASMDESTWVLTSYLVSNAIVLPMGGWFSMLFGRKRFYMICVALFTVSSFLCGWRPSLGVLIFFRVLQGIGGGALQPISQAILVESFPREKQGMAMAVYGMGVVVAPVIGPTLGGWITDNYTWRWIFFINIPVGILSLVLTALLIFDPPYLMRTSLGNGFKIDYVGFGLLALGLGSLEVVLDEGQKEDWFSSHFIVTFAAIMAVCLVGVVFWELRQKEPIIDFRILKDRNYTLATVSMLVLGFVLYGSTALLPLFLQTLLGYTAMMSGLVLSPGGSGDGGLPAGGRHAGAQVSAALAGDLRRGGLLAWACSAWRGSTCRSTIAPPSGAAWCRASGWRSCSCPSAPRRSPTSPRSAPAMPPGFSTWRATSAAARESPRRPRCWRAARSFISRCWWRI